MLLALVFHGVARVPGRDCDLRFHHVTRSKVPEASDVGHSVPLLSTPGDKPLPRCKPVSSDGTLTLPEVMEAEASQ